MNISTLGNGCVGCRACEQICPKQCISMQPNKEGFLYPVVDETKCIDCSLCVKKCAQMQESKQEKAPLAAYAVKNKDEKSLFRSASGGVSDVAVQKILEQSGIAFGAAYCEDLDVKHVAVKTKNDSVRLQSSKYVQSDVADTYTEVKTYLKQGKKVLYTGTPCQIAGLRQFLGYDDANLYTIDLICHGVPSPALFQKYLAYLEKTMNGKIRAYNFRYKGKRGWGTQYLAKIETDAKTKTKIFALDKYGKHFMAGDCYRECCYQCQYANVKNRPGDLTIGDFWGIEGFRPDFSSPLGVSCVVVNTEKGKELFEMMADSMEVIPAELDAVIRKQGNLVNPTQRPNSRDTFYDDFQAEDFVERLKVGLEPAERIKALLPRKLVSTLKRLRAAKGK